MSNTNHKNFGLTEAAFNDLRQKLMAGDEQLFEHVFLTHFEPCRAYLVREDKAGTEMAYDATMDAFLTFRQRLVQGKVSYGNLRFLLTRMARQHLLKRLGNKAAATVPLELLHDSSPLSIDAAEVDFDEGILGQLSAGWEQLGDACRKLLHTFYYAGKALKEIAEASGRTPAALRKQKQRCLDTLKGAILNDEMIG